MDRTHIIIVTTTVVSLAVFGLKVFSDRMEPGTQMVSQRAGSRKGPGFLGGTAAPGEQAGPVRSRGGRHPGSGVVGGGRQFGRLGARKGNRTTRGRMGSAEVVGEGGSSRGAGVGVFSGGTHFGGKGPRVALVGGGRARRLGADGARGAGRARTEIVDILASQPALDAAPQGGEDKSPEDGVVLALEVPEDADQAQQVDEVTPSDDGVGFDLSEKSVFAFPNAGNARGDAGTITFDVVPNWAGNEQTNNAFVRLQDGQRFNNRIEVVKNGRYLRFIFTPDGGKEADISIPIDDWEPGASHSITASWGPLSEGDPEQGGQTRLYIDGRAAGKNRYSGQLLIPSNTPMYIGSATGNYNGANGRMGNFKVYGRVLSGNEVAGF